MAVIPAGTMLPGALTPTTVASGGGGGAGAIAIAQALFGIAGTVSKIQGARLAADTARFEAQYAQRVSEFNAQNSLNNAKLINESALLERVRAGKVKERFLGEQRAAYAKAGVRMEGTPFQVLVETASELELDLQIDYFNAQVAAHAQTTQAALDRAQGGVYRYNEIMAKQQKRLAPLVVALEGAPRIINAGATAYNATKINQPARKPNATHPTN